MTCLVSACGDRNERVVHSILPAARNLREGAPVRYRGIEVGKVTTVRIVDTGVQLELHIQRADAPLRTGDRVRVAAMGMFGDAEVEIVPGPATAPKLASNGSLAAVPPDTLAAIREIVSDALAKQALGRLDSLLATARIQIHTDSVHPPAHAHP